jgi:hypothetical protein
MRRMVVWCAAVGALGLAGCANCEQLQESADRLVSQYARCKPGDTCQTVDMLSLAGGLNCLGAFQCFAAVNSEADLDELGLRARILSQQAAHTCLPQECVAAACLNPSELQPICDTELRRCVLVPRTP